MAWMQQYPNYTSENLVDVGTMILAGATYYFVHEGHPVIQMLRSSQVLAAYPNATQTLLKRVSDAPLYTG